MRAIETGMPIPELVSRLDKWLAGAYRASIFEDDNAVLAYALYREEKDHVYLRQFFVHRAQRRSGVGNPENLTQKTKRYKKLEAGPLLSA
jgi:hypothetical protein